MIENGRRVTRWALEPLRVFGGWRIGWRRWERTEDGWEHPFNACGDLMIYGTEGEARDAINTLERAACRDSTTV